MKRECGAHECGSPIYCKGWCRLHYERMKRTGRLDLPSTEDRFWAKVEKSDGCWIWTGAKSLGGYAQVGIDHKVVYGHRYAYEIARGPIPDGEQIDHMCHNRACVNPDHLRPVTRSENGLNRRGPQSGSKSGVLGVAWDSQRKKWYASVYLNGKSISAGRHLTIREAERAVRSLKKSLGIVVTGRGGSDDPTV